MTPPTYNELVEYLVDVRNTNYRDLPSQGEARLDAIESVLRSLLEKLRDEHEPL
jgi:hypothetical protein